MKPSFRALLLVSALTVGCGDDPPTAPTPRSVTTETITDVSVLAQSSGCVTFRQEAAGPAYAGILGSPTLELGTGTCTSPGPVLGRTTLGNLSLLLAAGDHYVRFDHRGNYDFTFRITLRYLILV
jgi:hypothetical protein